MNQMSSGDEQPRHPTPPHLCPYASSVTRPANPPSASWHVRHIGQQRERSEPPSCNTSPSPKQRTHAHMHMHKHAHTSAMYASRVK